MGTARPTTNFLPVIKCSHCGYDIELSRMGDHICGTSQDMNVRNPNMASNMGNNMPAVPAYRQRSASRPGQPPLRVDSNVANQSFANPHELTPASMSPRSGYSGHRQRPQVQRPPSPEYSNLDCAFPPWPTTAQRSATPVQEERPTLSRYDTNYTRKHAEPYNQPQPSPGMSGSGHSRAPSFGSTKSRRRGEPTSRPGTANGSRKPSLADISRGPRPMQPPPLPTMDAFAQRPLSPSRTQTFPLHNEDRISGTGPNSFIARRPSAPSPKPGRKSVPATDTDTLNALLGNSPPRSKRISKAASQPDTSPPRMASRSPAPPRSANPMFPARGASRSNSPLPIISPFSRPPLPTMPPLPPPPTASPMVTPPIPLLPTNAAPTTSLRTPRPALNPSPLPPPKSPMLAIAPDSPTDPFFQQGRLSPIPPTVAPSPSSVTNPHLNTASSSNSSQGSRDELPVPALKRRQTGGNKGICRGCNQAIQAGEKSVSSKDGQLSGRYHKQCFVCHTCRGPFATADFYVHQDRPFCAQHYHVHNGSVCHGCGKGIEGQYLAGNGSSVKAEKFHPSCLKCTTCKVTLQDDYFDWNGKVYCERDAKQAANVQSRSASPSPSVTPMGRPGGLPSGPRAALRPGQGAPVRTPSPLSADPTGLRPPPGPRRFPERRTTKLMMI